DASRAVGPVRPGVGLDGRLIGQFVVQPLDQLLAGDLGRKRSDRRFRDLVLRVEPRTRRDDRREAIGEPLEPVAGQGAHHEGLVEGERRVEPRRDLEQLRPLDEVDLVEDGEPWLPHVAERGRIACVSSLRPASASFRASISATIASASAAALVAAATIARSRRRLGANRPGVSTSTTCASPLIMTPRTVERVVCALRVTIDTSSPTSALRSVDFPALGAPTMATNPHRVPLSRPLNFRPGGRGTPAPPPAPRPASRWPRRFPARSPRARRA